MRRFAQHFCIRFVDIDLKAGTRRASEVEVGSFFFKPCNETRRSCKSQMNLLRKKLWLFLLGKFPMQFQPSKDFSCEFPGMGRSTAPATLHGKCGLVFWDSEHQSYRVMVSKMFWCFPLFAEMIPILTSICFKGVGSTTKLDYPPSVKLR